MAAKLTKTDKPGYFRRHKKGCRNADHSSRCNCLWVIHVGHRKKRRQESFRTYGEAREHKGKADSGDTKPRSKIKFGEYFSTWIDSYTGRTRRGFEEETRTEYRRAIKDNALPPWENELMVNIGSGDVRELYAKMKAEGKSPAAMKKVKAALSPLFNTAIEDEIVSTNAVRGVRIPAPIKTGNELATEEEDEERGKALTREELARFLRAVEGEDWRLFFEFLVVTGLRIGEAIGLTWANVILGGDKPRIRVREQIYKGKRKRYLKSEAGAREIPLSDEWAKRLLEHRRKKYEAGTESAPVFATRKGTPLLPSNVYRRQLAPAAIAAGLYVWVDDEDDEGKPIKRKKTAIAFHAMRHTCASLLFADGRNIKVISEWLGHSDPSFTLKVYIHLLDDGVGEGLDLPPLPEVDSATGVQRVDPGVDPVATRAA